MTDSMDVGASAPPADATAAAVAAVAAVAAAAALQEAEEGPAGMQLQEEVEQPAGAELQAAEGPAAMECDQQPGTPAAADEGAAAADAAPPALEAVDEMADTDLSDEPEEVHPAASVVYGPPCVTVVSGNRDWQQGWHRQSINHRVLL
jgi:hypothetical protein